MLIPVNIKEAIDGYVDHGHETGHFVTVVLSNDLVEAVSRADVASQAHLFNICTYVFNFIPEPCWGSKKKMSDWMALHKNNPVEAEKIAYGDRNNRRDYM